MAAITRRAQAWQRVGALADRQHGVISRDGRTEVDFLWPDHRFALEADSRDFHGMAVAFERDRRRHRELMRAGYSVRASPACKRNEKQAPSQTPWPPDSPRSS